MRITQLIVLYLPLGLLYAPPGGAQGTDDARRTPSVMIVRPASAHELKIWHGTRPSVLVQGETRGIPNGYRLYLGVHPTHSDSVWAHEVPANRQWMTEVYFGDVGSTPRDGDSFELVALLARNPPPERFNEFVDPSYYMSNIVTVNISVRSWVDRAVAFMKDLGVSVPIAALLASFGGIIGRLLEKRAAKKKEESQNGKTNPEREADS